IRSAGVGMSQLMRPYVLGGLLISGINLLNASFLEPAAAKEKISFEKQVLNETRSGLHEGTNIHVIEPENRIVTIESFDAKHLQASKVTVEQFNGSRLISRKDASRMVFDPAIDRWIMQKAAIRSFGADPGEISFSTGNDTLNLLLSIQSLQELSLQPEEMNLMQHYRYVKEKMQAGFPGLDRARVKLHAKTALPLASLVIIFIGVPLSTVKKRSGLAAEIAIALFIGFLFLGMQKTVASLGYNGIIEPWIAAWLPIILFLGAGALLYKKAAS
ncbi:MAG: YjgP/YjgQ family permease, partial [Chlorobium limicola]|nr:YjgP/YjgQ family permease [Chlorobium limicola]